MGVTAQELVSIHCSTCPGQIRLGDEICPSCKRTITRDELDALRRRWEGTDPEAAQLSNDVAYGRAALLVVAGLSLISGLVYSVIEESFRPLAFALTISAVMVGLFFWGRRRPLAAMVVGITAYLVLELVGALVSPESILRGILFKIFIIGTLGAGISAEVHRRKQETQLLRRRAGQR
jgi:hypothetical protein